MVLMIKLSWCLVTVLMLATQMSTRFFGSPKKFEINSSHVSAVCMEEIKRVDNVDSICSGLESYEERRSGGRREGGKEGRRREGGGKEEGRRRDRGRRTKGNEKALTN
jgi:hypothetical protein